MDLRSDQIRRYARHILLADVGGVGQARLLAASVRVGEAGGAGAVAIVYLAAAGVGRIVITDRRVVGTEDVGFLYEAADVGQARAEAARVRVAGLNPDVTVADDGDGHDLDFPPTASAVDALAAGSAAAGVVIRTLAAGSR